MSRILQNSSLQKKNLNVIVLLAFKQSHDSCSTTEEEPHQQEMEDIKGAVGCKIQRDLAAELE